MRKWLDLAALGAICDVTALTGFNRALAAQGLKVMSAWGNPGLKALMAAAGAGEAAATGFHAGFVLGPRINAGGRIGRSDLGARLLATDDPLEAAELAAELDALNVTRKVVEHETFEAAVRALEQGGGDPSAPVLVVSGHGWHPGVVGIVASRLRERYRRPAVVIGLDAAMDVGKGSGRSQPGVNLGRAVQAAFDEGLLLAGGGHAMAAGLTVRPDAVDELRAFLGERLAGERADAQAADVLEIDALVSAGSAGRALWTAFQQLTPFGPGNPEPLFAAPGVRIERPMAVRGGHVRCTLVDDGGEKLRAVAWRAADTALGRRLLAGDGSLHVVGRLRPDDWMGREAVEMEIEDAADPRQVG